MLLFVSVGLLIPAEDLPQTGYDESENQPFQSGTFVYHLLGLASASAQQKRSVPSCFAQGAGILELHNSRSEASRAALVLHCILLC